MTGIRLLRVLVRETLAALSVAQEQALAALDRLPLMASDADVFAADVFDLMVPWLEDVVDEDTRKRWSVAAKDLSLERVSLLGLTATQRKLNKDLLKQYIQGGTGGRPLGKSGADDQPYIVETSSARYVLDGHHRLATEILLGNVTASAKVYRDAT